MPLDTAFLADHVRYNLWATHRVLAAVSDLAAEELTKPLGGSFVNILGVLRHIYEADAIWFARIQGTNPGALDIPPALPQLENVWRSLMFKYVHWAEALGEGEWLRTVSYRNQKGKPFENPLWQIILHLVNHDSYHRGQVTNMLRMLGKTTVSTDLILYFRESEF